MKHLSSAAPALHPRICPAERLFIERNLPPLPDSTAVPWRKLLCEPACIAIYTCHCAHNWTAYVGALSFSLSMRMVAITAALNFRLDLLWTCRLLLPRTAISWLPKYLVDVVGMTSRNYLHLCLQRLLHKEQVEHECLAPGRRTTRAIWCCAALALLGTVPRLQRRRLPCRLPPRCA
eukprot:SAG11_NODE_2130_length_3778_cov_2.150584_5_plen_177_part_00